MGSPTIGEIKNSAASLIGGLVTDAFAYLSSRTIDIAGVPHVILPPNVRLESLAPLLERVKPARIRREVKANDVRGLVDYVNAFKGPTTKLYARGNSQPGLIARIDDHHPDDPSLVTHTCMFECPFTAEWQAWTKANKTKLGQVEFAEFIEANAKDVQTPTAADLFQLVTNFSDARSAEFSSAVRLSDGQVQFAYSESNKAGKAVLPEKMQLALPVFEGAGYAYQIDARLRYRLKDGNLILWFELDRPDVVLRQAYDQLLTKVTTETSVPLFRAL